MWKQLTQVNSYLNENISKYLNEYDQVGGLLIPTLFTDCCIFYLRLVRVITQLPIELRSRFQNITE